MIDHAETVAKVALSALRMGFGIDMADPFEDDLLHLGVAFPDGTFVEVHIKRVGQCPCKGRRWNEDENWSPDDPATWRGERSEGDGLIPCGFCNHGGWNVEQWEKDPDDVWREALIERAKPQEATGAE